LPTFFVRGSKRLQRLFAVEASSLNDLLLYQHFSPLTTLGWQGLYAGGGKASRIFFNLANDERMPPFRQGQSKNPEYRESEPQRFRASETRVKREAGRPQPEIH
jgi:hypothetical protein